MIITFTKPKDIVIVKEIKKTISEITINEITDNAEIKTIMAYTLELGPIILWEKESYDAIGQWTDTDVTNRIKEIYK